MSSKPWAEWGPSIVSSSDEVGNGIFVNNLLLNKSQHGGLMCWMEFQSAAVIHTWYLPHKHTLCLSVYICVCVFSVRYQNDERTGHQRMNDWRIGPNSNRKLRLRFSSQSQYLELSFYESVFGCRCQAIQSNTNHEMLSFLKTDLNLMMPLSSISPKMRSLSFEQKLLCPEI